MTARTSAFLKANFQNMDPQDFHDDVIDTFNIARHGSVASEFYVSPNGAAGNSGQSPDSPFLTWQEAIDACTDDVGDIIWRMPGTIDDLTTPILFNKAGITVLPTLYGASRVEGTEQGFSTYAGAGFTDGPAAIVSANCRIWGQQMISRNIADAAANTAAGSSASIVIDDTVNFVEISNCRFVRWWANVYAIKVIGSSYDVFSGNTFEGAFTNAIGVESGPINNPTYNKMLGNRFISCATCVNIGAGTGSDGNILAHNSVVDSTLFLDLNAQNSSPDSMAYDNYLDFANAAASFDVVNIAALEALGWKYVFNHYREV